jgi:hypothetical protein
MIMRRGFLIFLLAAGTVLGFSFAFARHCGWHHGYGPHAWGGYGHGRMALEDRAADACVRAAERVMRERGPDAKAPPPAAPAPPPAPPAGTP